MQSIITLIHVVACVLLVLVVLIQSGKGAEISASFSGSSQTVFGSSGGANFFTRFTAGTATIFMVTSLALTVIGGKARKSIFEGQTAPQGTTTPAPLAPGAKAPAPAAPNQPAAPAAPQAPAVPAGK
ncbi:MAG TPA: preprotein translocase subunit SecG [Bdellovibrionota bacterium]|nr:preprotein translocase subunit SecG [Bdellovibrionota bacterium]